MSQSRKKRTYSNSPRTFCVAVLLGASLHLQAEPVGVIGGDLDTDNAAYAGLLTDEAGSFTTVPGLPNDGRIYSTSINPSGVSFLVGRAENAGNAEGYFAFVSPNGSITISESIPSSVVDNDLYLYSGAINSSGNALIGGEDDGASTAYASLVSSEGNVVAVSLPDDGGSVTPSRITTVDYNSSGIGIVGGEGIAGAENVPYAVIVEGENDTTIVDGLTESGYGDVHGVAINDSGKGILGGYFDSNKILAGFVTTDGTFSSFYETPIQGVLESVAINESGAGLIGGQNEDGQLYAAAITADGTLTSLIDSPPSGTINSVALNTSGEGIIGGEYSNSGDDIMYGARISADGTVSPFELSTDDSSYVSSVDINDSGVGLVGGYDGSGGYAALVAPNGSVTELNLSSLNVDEIYSVALTGIPSSSEVLNEVTPTSVNATSSGTSVQFAAASALQTRFVEKNKVWSTPSAQTGTSNTAFNDDLLAYNTNHDDFSSIAPGRIGSSETPNAVWFQPFAQFLRVDREGSTPKYDNDTYGGLLGYDREGEQYLIGIAGGYAYNDTKFSGNQGSGKVHQGMLTVYGAAYWEHFWMGAALWGGRYFLENTRKTLSFIDSVGKTHGWIFSPQVEVASPWALDEKELYHIEPFASVTWVKNWQDGYTETGASGLNLVLPDFSTSIWQFEAGLKFYEKFMFKWGQFRLEEKVSYVNQNPSGDTTAQTSFVGAASSFPVAIASSQVQNLFSAEVVGIFLPKKTHLPYGGFSAQVDANGQYQSYNVSLFIGGRF